MFSLVPLQNIQLNKPQQTTTEKKNSRKVAANLAWLSLEKKFKGSCELTQSKVPVS